MLTEGMPTNDKHMQNADRCSSRPIGDPSIPFNAMNLGNNGNLILGRVTPALNTRNTPRWTEKDQMHHGGEQGGKRKIRTKTENRERQWKC